MSTVTQQKEVPLRYQISYKESEKGLLLMESVLMKHFRMGRSDLHKYFCESQLQLAKEPKSIHVTLDERYSLNSRTARLTIQRKRKD